MEAASTADTASTRTRRPGDKTRRYRSRKPRNADPLTADTTNVQDGDERTIARPKRQNKGEKRSRPQNEGTAASDAVGPGNTVDSHDLGQGTSQPQKSVKPQRSSDGINASAHGKESEVPSQSSSRSRGRRKFETKLTEPTSPSVSTSVRPERRPERPRKREPKPEPDDLTSRLSQALRHPPYPDCPICFAPINPYVPTWSCSPSIPTILPDDADPSEPHQYCWTTFHLKCIKSWAQRSVKEIAEAWAARGQSGKRGDWRCPGCQGKREEVPSAYRCFCNSTVDPKPPRFAIPHSCASPCSRIRESGCSHACPLSCHPGPCPPCRVVSEHECYCPRKIIRRFPCGSGQARDPNGEGLSCGNVCGRLLRCGKHTCRKICHQGDCDECSVRELARCWCGKVEKVIGCGEGEEVQCSVETEGEWIGRFACENVCGRPFDCGHHQCKKPCHPPSHRPVPCPFSPSNVTHCPCGKYPIASSSASSASPPSHTALPARSHCTSPIPTCGSICGKARLECEHPCAAKCHTGDCPSCMVPVIRPCRCGSTTKTVPCHEFASNTEEVLCTKPCTALRACGKHECRRLCCPLASLASSTGKKGKRRDQTSTTDGIGEERGGLHECDLVCNKLLACGNHHCEERDHRGPCPPCLRSSFEEMVCFCGRTIVDPPIPCGTRIKCLHPCPRPPPPCGHPLAPHTCHEDPVPCPPCPFLTTKRCACGKKEMINQRCSLENEKVSCGTVCGKLMSCGFHHCERLCHSGECGSCTAPCGKYRKLCLPDHHTCPFPCHAPASCSEDSPCQAIIVLSCNCGRLRQSVQCGKCTSNKQGLASQRTPPKCNRDCEIEKRNAKLADALGITKESRDKVMSATYHHELVAFAKANVKFLAIVEKALAEFVASDKKKQVLPPMPVERRKFVGSLAAVYRMDTQMLDQEPYRSVGLIRRLDTRIPVPLLSATIASSMPAGPNLGKLADLRNPNSASASAWRAGNSASSFTSTKPSGIASPVPSLATPNRDWTSVVAKPPSKPATPQPTTGPRSYLDAPQSSSPARPLTPVRPASSTLHPAEAGHDAVPDNWEDDV